ncbi:asparaginase [Nocardioides humi]|uniref:Asparaginase n=1 Tax=Nocardioides humi TaxID=449461 RepID=A0ABN2AWG4_9ACTN|nr:asparaginase [Nocardioides humi]
MTTPTVAIGALGGTIASTSSATDGSEIVPTLTAESLVAAVPGLDAVATVRAETLARLPSPSLDEPTIMRTLLWAQAAVDAGAAGAVVTQGTDTLEESAYLLDLFWDRPAPLVVTGAMRSAGAVGADGPANLLTAVRCALAPVSRDRGVLVAFGDEIHQARWVAKTDSMSPSAFRSPAFGPVGRCAESLVEYAAPPARVPPLRLSRGQETGDPRVPLVATYLGDAGYLLDAIRPEDVDGVVVAGFGAGHVSAGTAEAVGRLARQVPVVFASRTGSGPTGRAMYGYPGSEVDLLARGAVGAGWLPPVKARLLLWALALRGPVPRADVATAFAERGRL